MSKMVWVKIVSAVVIGGAIVAPGKGKDSCREVDEAFAKSLMNRGKADLATEEDMQDDDQPKALEEMTVPELKTRAKELEIEGADSLKKADLIAAIKDAEDEDE